MSDDSNLLAHAERELATLRSPDFDAEEDGGMQDEMDKCVLDVVRIFADQGHSGSSASYAIGIIEKVLRFEPVTPLTGGDDEWVDIAEQSAEPLFQNARCGRVFKAGVDGEAYDIEGYVFRDPDGSMWTNGESRRSVTFPYRPTTEIVDRPDEDAS